MTILASLWLVMAVVFGIAGADIAFTMSCVIVANVWLATDHLKRSYRLSK